MRRVPLRGFICHFRAAYRRRQREYYESKFSKKFGIKTNHLDPSIGLPDVSYQIEKSGGHSKTYEALSVLDTRKAIRRALIFQPKARSYIDIGSGMGKTLFLASEFRQFNQIIGVELLDQLVQITRENLRIHPCSRISIHCMDARDFQFDSETSVILMFNPFDEIIMNGFLVCNSKKIKESNSVIAYVNDVHREILAVNGFTLNYRYNKRKISIWN
jgi:SAM-dependent methyltransferase